MTLFRLGSAVLAAFLMAVPLHADGPHIALHAAGAVYEVTVFSAPDPLVTGRVDLSALVQDAGSGAVLPQAQVTGELRLPSAGQPIPLALSVAASPDPPLPGETVKITAPGTYRLRLHIRAAGLPAESFQGDVPVAADQGRRNTVLWAVFLAMAAVLLFLANQTAKQRLRAHLARSR